LTIDVRSGMPGGGATGSVVVVVVGGGAVVVVVVVVGGGAVVVVVVGGGAVVVVVVGGGAVVVVGGGAVVVVVVVFGRVVVVVEAGGWCLGWTVVGVEVGAGRITGAGVAEVVGTGANGNVIAKGAVRTDVLVEVAFASLRGFDVDVVEAGGFNVGVVEGGTSTGSCEAVVVVTLLAASFVGGVTGVAAFPITKFP
jgi:hypothetical protein